MYEANYCSINNQKIRSYYDYLQPIPVNREQGTTAYPIKYSWLWQETEIIAKQHDQRQIPQAKNLETAVNNLPNLGSMANTHKQFIQAFFVLVDQNGGKYHNTSPLFWLAVRSEGIKILKMIFKKLEDDLNLFNQFFNALIARRYRKENLDSNESALYYLSRHCHGQELLCDIFSNPNFQTSLKQPNTKENFLSSLCKEGPPESSDYFDYPASYYLTSTSKGIDILNKIFLEEQTPLFSQQNYATFITSICKTMPNNSASYITYSGIYWLARNPASYKTLKLMFENLGCTEFLYRIATIIQAWCFKHTTEITTKINFDENLTLLSDVATLDSNGNIRVKTSAAYWIAANDQEGEILEIIFGYLDLLGTPEHLFNITQALLPEHISGSTEENSNIRVLQWFSKNMGAKKIFFRLIKNNHFLCYLIKCPEFLDACKLTGFLFKLEILERLLLGDSIQVSFGNSPQYFKFLYMILFSKSYNFSNKTVAHELALSARDKHKKFLTNLFRSQNFSNYCADQEDFLESLCMKVAVNHRNGFKDTSTLYYLKKDKTLIKIFSGTKVLAVKCATSEKFLRILLLKKSPYQPLELKLLHFFASDNETSNLAEAIFTKSIYLTTVLKAESLISSLTYLYEGKYFLHILLELPNGPQLIFWLINKRIYVNTLTNSASFRLTIRQIYSHLKSNHQSRENIAKRPHGRDVLSFLEHVSLENATQAMSMPLLNHMQNPQHRLTAPSRFVPNSSHVNLHMPAFNTANYIHYGCRPQYLKANQNPYMHLPDCPQIAQHHGYHPYPSSSIEPFTDDAYSHQTCFSHSPDSDSGSSPHINHPISPENTSVPSNIATDE